jgi:predicted ester cyclase
MSVELNKAVVLRVNAAMNARDWDMLMEVMIPEFVTYLCNHPFLTVFPDIQTTINDIVAEGDKVVTRWTNRGTHRAEWMGAAPTGRQVTYSGISIDRIASGRVVESWRTSDQLGLLQQIGAVSIPS